MDNVALLALVKAMQAGGGGTSAQYYGGNGIDITDNTIRTKIDGDTILYDDGGNMYVTTDLTRKDFTASNIIIYNDYKDGILVESTGDAIEDTLVWESGRVEFNIEAHTENIKGNMAIFMVDYTDEEYPEYEEYFDIIEETAGSFTKMIWDLTDNIFTLKFEDAAGNEYVMGTRNMANMIAHYEAYIFNSGAITVTSATGKMFDPFYPLPHDARLDYAFDETGYVNVGNKRIQLRDLTTMDLKDITYEDIYSFFDGEYSYIYDFYRRNYSMIWYEETSDVNIELEIDYSAVTKGITFGIYDQSNYGLYFQPIEMGTCAADDVSYIQFTAKWNSTEGTYTMNWYAKDKEYKVIWSTEQEGTTQYGIGPYGIFVKLLGKVGIYDLVKYADEFTGVYTRFTLDKTNETVQAEWKRDVKVIEDASSYNMLVEYGANSELTDASYRNYNFTNGIAEFTPNNVPDTGALPLGEWYITVYNEGGNELCSLHHDETDTAVGNYRLKYIEFVRDAQGSHIIATDANDTKIDLHVFIDRDVYTYIELQWIPKGTMPTELPSLYTDCNMKGLYEKRSSVDIATTETYGIVKYDGNTISVNDNGQLYVDDTVMQRKLTAGQNITIEDNTISATDTTYTSGSGIEIVNDAINAAVDGTTIGINSEGKITLALEVITDEDPY